VVPLGRNDVWKSGIDLVDVAMNIVAFETMNQVKLEMRLSVGDRQGRACVLITALAHDRSYEIGEVPSLASVNVNCLALNLRSVDAALIHALYLLDGKLAEEAVGNVQNK